jgi:hypothetical protein
MKWRPGPSPSLDTPSMKLGSMSTASFMVGIGLEATSAKLVKRRADRCLGGDVGVPRMGGEGSKHSGAPAADNFVAMGEVP